MLINPQSRSLGGYTYTFFDYYFAGITNYLDHPATNASRLVLDVLTFKDRYAKHQVNYMITAGNDEFFLVDNPNYFYDQLGGQTLMRIIPNQGHGGVAGGEYQIGRFSMSIDESFTRRQETDSLWQSLESIFASSMWRPEALPAISTVFNGNTIEVSLNMPTNRIRHFFADSAAGRRDWRTTKIGNATHDFMKCGEDGVLDFAMTTPLVPTGVGELRTS